MVYVFRCKGGSTKALFFLQYLRKHNGTKRGSYHTESIGPDGLLDPCTRSICMYFYCLRHTAACICVSYKRLLHLAERLTLAIRMR